MLLNFLIESQKNITQQEKELQPIEDLKIQCDKIISNKKFIPALPQILAASTEERIIRHHILDPEYFNLFHCMKERKFFQQEKISDNIFALFTSPLDESWKESMACLGDEQFAIRTGFFQDEYEIFKSILMGFHALTIYVTGLDYFQIQYLTEIARDYLFSLFFVIHSKEELNTILETDAPYFVFSTYQKKNFTVNPSLLYNLSQFVPRTANLFALGPSNLVKNKNELADLGYCGLIVGE